VLVAVDVLGMTSNTKQTAARTKIETLEDRRMMSVSVLGDDGVLTITGEAQQSNRMNLSLVKGGTELRIADGRGLLQRVALEEVQRIEVRGGLRNDVVRVSPKITVGTTIYGGAGNDRILAGGGIDSIYGEAGNDHITLSYGDTVVDTEGDNRIRRTGGKANQLPTAIEHPDNTRPANPGQRPDPIADHPDAEAPVEPVDPTLSDPDYMGQTQSASTPAIVRLVLINAGTDKSVAALANGATIDLASYPGGINVRAQGNGLVKSVRFGLDADPTYKVENSAPFTIGNDRGWGQYNAWRPSVGTHTMTVTGYTGASATGRASQTQTVTFKVVDSATNANPTPAPTAPTAPRPAPTPTPTPRPSTGGNKAPAVSFINPHDGDQQAYPGHYVVRVNASDSDGKVAKVEFFANGRLFETTTEAPFSAPWVNVAPGDYTLTARVTDDDGATTSATIDVGIKAVGAHDTYYVSTSGADDNSGASAGKALRTINHAASLAGPGDTIIIMPGTYRETVRVQNSGTSANPITFKAQQPGTVFIDGSEKVSGWTRAGSSDVYSAPWSHDFFLGNYRYHRSDPVAGHAENFVHNGKRLSQVLSKSDLSEGEFYVDWNANKVHVWLQNDADARDTTVYGGTRKHLMVPANATSGKFITVDGINFRNAANFAQDAAVKTNDGWVVKNSRFEDMSNAAFGIYGDNTFVYNNKFANNGHVALTGTGSNALLVDNDVYGNNERGYRWAWESGGAKLTRTQGLYVINYNGYDNNGAGLWLDIFNSDYVIKGGFFHDNKAMSNDYEGMGLFLEINGAAGRVEGASFYGNVGSGLSVSESENVTVRGNYFGDNLEVRNMLDRPYSLKNLTIDSNRFENAKVISSIGALTTDSFRTLNIRAYHNVFDNGASDWYSWKGVKANTAAEIYAALGVDWTASAGDVTIPRAA
jgi:hypothetical protein